jgi:hypothetical protein
MVLLIKKPGGWLPIAMSIAAFSLVLGYVAIFGVQERQADEGAAARVFQLLLAGQVPIMAFFAINWVPRMPKQALQVIALQFIAALAAFGLVAFLEM